MSKKKRKEPVAESAPREPAVILVSYVPLLRGKAGVTLDVSQDKAALDAIGRQLETAPPGRADCCFWLLDDDGRPLPVLALEQAVAIADHLVEWANNEPAKWFRLYLKEQSGKYVLVLFPEVKQSIGRFKFAHLLEGGEPLKSDEFQVLTRPLHFVSGANTAYAGIKDKIGQTLSVGLVDVALIDWNNPFSLDPARIRTLGPFAIGDGSESGMSNYLDDLLADATDAPKYPSRINPAAVAEQERRGQTGGP